MEKYNKEEFDNYLKIGINRAKNSLNHFFELLEIDPELFNHLFDIEIIIDYDNKVIKRRIIDGKLRDEEFAIYSSADNNTDDKIYISKDYIRDLLLDLKDNYISRQDVINDIALTIVHEILHRNRTIILDKTLKYDDVPYYDKYNELFKNHDIEMYKKLLDDTISSGFYNYFDRYIPIKATIKENNKYDVLAYDKINDIFCLYNNQSFGLDSDKPLTLLKIGLELNTIHIVHDIDERIPYNNGPYEEEYYAHSIAYYHQSNLNESKEDRDIRLKNLIFLEESLVEIIAKFIIYSRKMNSLDIKDFYNKIINDEDIDDNEKLAVTMLYKMGLSTVKWFVLSSYEDEYDDKLYKVFKEKYNALLEHFKNIMINSKDYDKSIADANEIINEKLR